MATDNDNEIIVKESGLEQEVSSNDATNCNASKFPAWDGRPCNHGVVACTSWHGG